MNYLPRIDRVSRSASTARRAAVPEAVTRTNALLEALPLKESARVMRTLTPVRLTFGDVLYDAGIIRHVYFPVDCLLSLLAPLKGRAPAEVALVGSEGMLGVPLALGAHTSHVVAIVRGSGNALRGDASLFHGTMKANPTLLTGIHRYIDMLTSQLTQTAACNAYHPLEARFARWLLTTSDRMESDELESTHEFAAHMLGVRRVGVTVAAGNLQRQGLIGYSRGHITILDRKSLEKNACECYAVLKKLYEKLDQHNGG